MTKLILVRHGETAKNVKGKLHGYDDPEVLNDVGRRQIEKTANKLKEFNPTIIYCSKEKRAIQSAEILSKELGISFEPIKGMQERNWGIYSGKPWSEVQVVLDPMTLDERYNYVPPQGESWKEFEERLVGAVEQVLRENKDKSIVMVTHGGAIRALMPHLLSVPKEESFKYDPANASITMFEHNNDVFSKVMVDDISHLKKN